MKAPAGWNDNNMVRCVYCEWDYSIHDAVQIWGDVKDYEIKGKCRHCHNILQYLQGTKLTAMEKREVCINMGLARVHEEQELYSNKCSKCGQPLPDKQPELALAGD